MVMATDPRSIHDAKVDKLVKDIKRGMYRKQGDCECDICKAHAALKELESMAREPS